MKEIREVQDQLKKIVDQFTEIFPVFTGNTIQQDESGELRLRDTHCLTCYVSEIEADLGGLGVHRRNLFQSLNSSEAIDVGSQYGLFGSVHKFLRFGVSALRKFARGSHSIAAITRPHLNLEPIFLRPFPRLELAVSTEQPPVAPQIHRQIELINLGLATLTRLCHQYNIHLGGKTIDTINEPERKPGKNQKPQLEVEIRRAIVRIVAEINQDARVRGTLDKLTCDELDMRRIAILERWEEEYSVSNWKEALANKKVKSLVQKMLASDRSDLTS
jgi:hypothetical protein